MPTSSQAMILRSTDVVRAPTAMVSYKCITPFYKADTSYQNESIKYGAASPLGRGERVQFDISVCANHDMTIDGFEGVFAYDQKTQSYRWQLFTVSPKGRTRFTQDKNEIGDIDTHDETIDNDSYLTSQSSVYNGHFTTPAESIIDNTAASYKLEGQDISPSFEMDDATYRRLEELGFRRRTTYTPSGSLIHVNQAPPSSQKQPQRSTSELIDSTRVPKLSVRNLNRESTLKQNTSNNRSVFPPQSFVSGDSMRKRVPPVKQKSLLDEVKGSVNWANRVTPSTHHKNALKRNLENAVCFSLRDSWKYDHLQLKHLVESQILREVKTLQFDPISLRLSDGSVLDRWIVGFEYNRDCLRAIELGLAVDGDKVVVRSWDDIVKEEQGEDWEYPCSYRLSSAKHDRVIRKFLQVH